jgi:hypothetical protein
MFGGNGRSHRIAGVADRRDAKHDDVPPPWRVRLVARYPGQRRAAVFDTREIPC